MCDSNKPGSDNDLLRSDVLETPIIIKNSSSYLDTESNHSKLNGWTFKKTSHPRKPEVQVADGGGTVFLGAAMFSTFVSYIDQIGPQHNTKVVDPLSKNLVALLCNNVNSPSSREMAAAGCGSAEAQAPWPCSGSQPV